MVKATKLTTFSLIFSLAVANHNASAEWSFNPELSSSIDAYQRTSELNADIEDEVFSISPKLALIYSGNKSQGTFFVAHTKTKSNSLDSDRETAFTNYQANFTSSIFSELLQLRLRGSQDTRALNTSQVLVDDIISSPSNLSTVQRYTAGLRFNNSPQSAIKVASEVQYTSSKTDSVNSTQSISTGNEFTNTGSNASLRLSKEIIAASGGFSWDVDARHQKTQRDLLADFESTNVNFEFTLPLYSKLRFLVQGNHERNNAGSSDFTEYNGLDRSSYGAGLRWFSAKGRELSVSYNVSDNDNNAEKQKYVNARLLWSLSSRTSIDLSHDKRFFGDTTAFLFNYNTQDVRLRLRYDEQLTTFSRITEVAADRVMICNIGDSQLQSCFQPDLGYELLPGEIAVDFQYVTPEISEEIFIRKAGNLDMTWKTRRLNVGVGFGGTRSEYIESNQSQEQKTGRIFARYDLNERRSINVIANWIEAISNTAQMPVQTSTIALGLNQRLGRNMNFNITARYLDQELEDGTTLLKENRLTANIVYRFGANSNIRNSGQNRSTNSTTENFSSF